tara:strand:- start:19 stop:417 length:399 start_codon:yes stop_codon:yes gene_type:complete
MLLSNFWHLEQNSPDFVTQDRGKESEQEDWARVAMVRAMMLTVVLQEVEITSAQLFNQSSQVFNIDKYFRLTLLACTLSLMLGKFPVITRFLSVWCSENSSRRIQGISAVSDWSRVDKNSSDCTKLSCSRMG